MDQNKTLPQGLQTPDYAHHIRLVKAVALAVLATLGFGLSWTLLATGLAHPHDLLFWFGPLVSAAFGITFLAFLAIVNANRWIFLATNLGILGCYLAILPKDLFVITGGVLFLALSFLFERHIRSDEKSRADFALNRIIRSSINLMVYALLLVVGFNVYYKVSQNFQAHPEQFYNQVGHYAARGLEYVPSGLGDFDPNQTFDQFVTKQAERQDTQLGQAPPDVRNQVVEEFKKQLLDRFNIQVSGNPLLGDVVAGAVAERTQKAAASHEQLFPAIFAVIVVVVLRGVAFLFIWLTELVSWLSFQLLLFFKFFRIKKVQIEVNKLQI